MDLERDLFRVTFAAGTARTEAALLDAVRNLNYTPTLVDTSSFRKEQRPVHATGEPPQLIRRALERARSERKRFVLVDCMGDT